MIIEDERIKEIIDKKNINITFNSKSLNREQKTKLNNYINKNIYLLDNYYYNKIENKYENELLQKLNSIINDNNNDSNDNNKLILNLIQLLLLNKNDLRNLIKKNYSINIILNDIELKIKEEKILLENLLLFIHKNNNEFKSRLNDLNNINRQALKDLLNNNHYFIYIREYLIKLLNSSLILINTFIILLINYQSLKIEDNEILNFKKLELKNAINLFENVKESIIDNNDYNKNFKIQKRYYYNLINSINKNNSIKSYLVNDNINDNDNDNDELKNKYYKIIENDIKTTEKMFKFKKNEKKNKKISYMNIFKIISFKKKKIKELSISDKLLNERNQMNI